MYFSQAVNIPAGAELHVFNSKMNKVLGAFKDGNEGFKALEMLPGDRIVFEYSEKASSKDLPNVQISEIVFFYRLRIIDNFF